MRTHKDSDGHVLYIGDRVAYNRSGTVTAGVLEHITPGGTAHIRNTSRRDYWHNKISRVKLCSDLLRISP